jgi:hypothetical protein
MRLLNHRPKPVIYFRIYNPDPDGNSDFKSC